MNRRCTEAGEHFSYLSGVRDQLVIFDMGVGLLDQPLLRIPRAVCALSREPLDTAAPADVLNAKPDKLSGRPDRNMKVTAGAAAARLGPALRPSFVGHTDLQRDDTGELKMDV